MPAPERPRSPVCVPQAGSRTDVKITAAITFISQVSEIVEPKLAPRLSLSASLYFAVANEPKFEG
jgi:hypothetical protein